MGRAPCCSKVGLLRGPWSTEEDEVLTKYVQAHGEGNWRSLPKKAGLLRCGKSCRLRWMNYLRPDIKRGNITPDEDDLIIRMHKLLGNRWSLIAGRLPGRTDNEIKNYWNTHLSKRLGRTHGTDPDTRENEPGLREPIKRPNKRNRRQKDGKPPETIVETEKLKVHNPKAVRIKPLSSFSSLTSQEGGDRVFLGTEVVDIPKEYGGDDHHFSHETGFLIGDDIHRDDQDHDINDSSEFEGMFRGNTLEELYDEYLQLLSSEDDDQVQLDQFAESLLV